MLRGIVARGGGRTVVALRTAELVTFTEMDIDHPHALVPVLTAGLTQHPPARFDEFSLPARVGRPGRRADPQRRAAARRVGVFGNSGVGAAGGGGGVRPAAHLCRDRRRTAPRRPPHQHRRRREHRRHPGRPGPGRPSKAFDGEWVSTFTPGTPLAIAAAVERLTAALPDGPWFPDLTLTRDFDERIGKPMPDNAVMPIVRVAVLAAADDGGRLTEVALPAELPLREILPAVQRLVSPARRNRRRARAVEPGADRRRAVQPRRHAGHRGCGRRRSAGIATGARRPARTAHRRGHRRRRGDLLRCPRTAVGDQAHIQPRSGRGCHRADPRRHRACRRAPSRHRCRCSACTRSAALPPRQCSVHCSAASGSPRLATALAVTALVPVAAAFALAVPGEFGGRRRCCSPRRA